MLAGSHYEIINPEVGCEMEGYESRFATGIHDDLSVSALYLEAQSTRLLFIALDMVAVPGYRVDRIKRVLQEKMDLAPEQVIISAIHTHSGPTVTDLLLDSPHIDEGYWAKVTAAAVKAAERAAADPRPGELALRVSKVPAGIYANRNRQDLPYNPDIVQLVVLTANQKLQASLFLLGSHPTIMNAKNTQITADLVGGVRHYYQAVYGIRPLVMLTDCGDTSTRYTRKESSFAEVDTKAKALVESLATYREKRVSLEKMQVKIVPFASDYDPITAPQADALWRKVNDDYNNAAGDRRAELAGFLSTYRHIRYFGHTHFQTTSEVIDMPGFRIVTYPGELVNALGSAIRSVDGKPTLLITLANDYRGYSVDEAEFGQYFESYNSVFLKGEADKFVEKIRQAERSLAAIRES